MATRDLLVRVLGDSKSLERTFLKSSATGKVFGRDMEVVGRKVDKSFAGLTTLSSGRGFAGGLVAAAAITGLKRVVDAASNAQQVLGQTRVALEDSGLSWDRYGKQVEAAAASLTKLGFDDEETLKSIATFSRATGSVSKAISDTALAADVARARYIDLASASNIVLKASLGQAGALRRIGIDARKGASGVELLTLLTEKYGGAAKAAGNDATTANQRLRVSLQNVQETIGSGSLPLVAALANGLSDAADSASILATKLKGLGVSFDLPTKSGKILNHTLTDYITFYPILKDVLGGTKKSVDNLGDSFKNTAVAAKAFSDSVGLGALQAAGKSQGPPGFTPGHFKIPAAANRKPFTVEQRNTFFDAALGRSLDRVQDSDLQGQLGKLAKIAATISKRIAVTKDITRKLNLEDQLVGVQRQRKSVEQQIGDVLAQRVADAKAAKIEQRAAALEKLHERQAAALQKLQSRQFRALGLNAQGGDIVPGVANLKKQLGSLTDRLAASPVKLSSKLQSQLAGIGKVLGNPIEKATVETREKIQELFQTIRGEFDKGSKDTSLTKSTQLTSRVLSGLVKIPKDEKRILEARLSHFNSGGIALSGSGFGSSGRIVVQAPDVTMVVDGRVLGKASAKAQGRTRKVNPSARRGPNAGLTRA